MGGVTTRLTLGALGLGALLGLTAVLAAEQPASAGAEPEIRSLLERQAEAWSRGDLETFCSVYAEDAVFLSPSGLTRTRQAVLERYRKRYPDAAAMGRLSLEVLEIDLAVSPNGDTHGAAVVARWSLAYPDRDTASGLTLIVFRRAGGEWKIVHDASM